ncbi:MAG: tetratricopeptide repeat protein [Planctomycetota bacterium]
MDAKSWIAAPLAVLLATAAVTVAADEGPAVLDALDPPPVTRVDLAGSIGAGSIGAGSIGAGSIGQSRRVAKRQEPRQSLGQQPDQQPDRTPSAAPASTVLAMPPWPTPDAWPMDEAISRAFSVEDWPEAYADATTPPEAAADTVAESTPTALPPVEPLPYPTTHANPVQPAAHWAAASRIDPAALPSTGSADDTPDKKTPNDNEAVEIDTQLAAAQKLASNAESRDDLTAVIKACLADPPPSTELRRLAAWALNRRGELAIEAGDALLAVEDFRSAIDLDADCWPAWNNRGVTLAEQGRHADAIADFTRVIELNPRAVSAYRNRGEAYAASGQTDRAVVDYTAATALGPVDPSLLAARGVAHHRLGQIDRAVADFNLALQVDPRNAAALAHRGDVYARAGNYEQAIVDLDFAVRIEPSDAASHRSLAWVLATCPDEALRNPERAVAAARRGLRLAAKSLSTGSDNGDLALHLDTLAVSLAAAGHFTDAVVHGKHAVEIAPEAYREVIGARLDGYRRGEAFSAKSGRR